MKLSLTLISEHLCIDDSEYNCVIKYSNHFSQIKLLTDEITFLERDILYLGDHVPKAEMQNKHSGLILTCSEEETFCDTLFINSSLSIYDILNKVLNVFYKFNNYQLRISDSVSNNCSLQRIIEIFSELLQNPVYLVDNSFKVLALCGEAGMREMSATWKALEDIGYIPYGIVQNLIESSELTQMELHENAALVTSSYFYTPFINYNLKYNSGFQGHFFVVGMMKEITEGDIEIVNYLGRYILAALLANPDFVATRGQGYEHFMLDVINGKITDLDFIEKRIAHLGIDMDGDFLMCKVDCFNSHDMICGYIARELEKINNCKPIIENKSIISVIQLNDHNSYDYIIEFLKKLGKRYKCRIGLSDIFNGFSNVKTYYKQSILALKTLETGTSEKYLCLFSDDYFHHILRSISNNIEDLLVFCSREALKVFRHDASHNSDYGETLQVYFETGKNTLQSAKFLHIHRNTMLYRLEKIQEICGCDFNDSSCMQRLLFSLRILEFLNMNKR